LSIDEENFAGLLESLGSYDSPQMEQIIQSLGQSVESNTFEKYAKVYFQANATNFYSSVSVPSCSSPFLRFTAVFFVVRSQLDKVFSYQLAMILNFL